MNKVGVVLIEGSVGREPSWLDLGGGKRAASFPVAVRRTFKDGKGRVQTEAVYYQIRAEGELAQTAAKLKKGSTVRVVGALGQSVSVNSKGLSVSTVFVAAHGIELVKERIKEEYSKQVRQEAEKRKKVKSAAKFGCERGM